MKKFTVFVFCILTLFPAFRIDSAGTQLAGKTPAEKRALVLKAPGIGDRGLPVLKEALNDTELLVRRTAVRMLEKMGDKAVPILMDALENTDAEVRRSALTLLADRGKVSPGMLSSTLKKDESPLVRQTAVMLLLKIEPRTEEIKELLVIASSDKSPFVREPAADALWPYYKQTTTIRDRDREVKIAQTIKLPPDNWKFQTDPMKNKHTEKCYAVDFDDKKWDTIGIESAWQNFGYNYEGVAWYRKTFRLPEKPQKYEAVEINFEAVDESAWVWINGEYAGQHDIGLEGWLVPFQLDITDLIKWNDENQITVRVMNVAFAGGIWKPVMINVLTH
ncbi:MAG: HEAT repeat domain-containing protein [Candidatus Omnitrophica bacterium]|nr:HEAT repeat domain-containing protein [Candidatus Omnitrophota bacterium]